MHINSLKIISAIIFFSFIVSNIIAQDSLKPQRLNIHFQTTYIYQIKPSFNSPYEGINSLTGKPEKENSITATLYVGARLWKDAEVYINPEIAGGSGLSGATGMAGSSNGETFRVGDPSPTLYSARYYLKQTFALSKERSLQDDNANQLSIYQPKNYLSLWFGKFSLGDVFDQNAYCNSPRTQFMNWSLMNDGAWDYAANVRGYTYSFTSVLQLNSFTYKLSFATLPKEANGKALNTDFKDSFAVGINAEVDKSFSINEKEAHIKLLAFYNRANFGNYEEAVKTTGIPDVTATRKLGRTKTGFEVNADVQLNKTEGLFTRAGWNDGKNETWVFTEIDRTACIGISFNGNKWKRKDDNAGIAAVLNGISKEHRNYIAKGGSGFILGDGKLNYGAESIAELYYNFKPSDKLPLWLTADYQFALNPGYNKDRGPVNIFSFRVHTQF